MKPKENILTQSSLEGRLKFFAGYTEAPAEQPKGIDSIFLSRIKTK